MCTKFYPFQEQKNLQRLLWLGLNDRKNPGFWEWSDGSPLSLVNWFDGQPNSFQNKEENCAAYVAKTLVGYDNSNRIHGWGDTGCNSYGYSKITNFFVLTIKFSNFAQNYERSKTSLH